MYKVTFFDGTEFDGGEPESSMWDMLPNKPIKSILYWLNEKEKYLFSDFEEYCHCVEKNLLINPTDLTPGKPIERVTKAIIMGRVKQRVYQVVFDLKRGQVYRLVTPYGQEYSSQERLNDQGVYVGHYNGKPLSGWLQGILDENGYPGPKLKKITPEETTI
jgi:hypothetical protein